MNILNMPDDILNKIGNMVKRDNAIRIEKEELFRYTDEGLEELKYNNRYNREDILDIISDRLYDGLYNGDINEEDIEEYQNTRNVNYVYFHNRDEDFEDYDDNDYYEYATEYYNKLNNYEDNILYFA